MGVLTNVFRCVSVTRHYTSTRIHHAIDLPASPARPDPGARTRLQLLGGGQGDSEAPARAGRLKKVGSETSLPAEFVVPALRFASALAAG